MSSTFREVIEPHKTYCYDVYACHLDFMGEISAWKALPNEDFHRYSTYELARLGYSDAIYMGRVRAKMPVLGTLIADDNELAFEFIPSVMQKGKANFTVYELKKLLFWLGFAPDAIDASLGVED